MAYIQSIENLIATYPDLQSLAGCTPVKHAISDVALHQRKPFKTSVRFLWACIFTGSIDMMMLTLLLIVKACQDKLKEVMFHLYELHVTFSIPRLQHLKNLTEQSSLLRGFLRKHMYIQQSSCLFKLPVPVVSVRNLTWGGNGKTPMVEFIANWLTNDVGVSPLILTRGYGGVDEAKMLQRHFDGTSVKIAVGANRAAIAALFLHRYWFVKPLDIVCFKKQIPERRIVTDKIGVAILDDGMQHITMSSDLDIVMVNALLDYSAHHRFRNEDIKMIKARLEDLKNKFDSKPVIVVIEKDYDRDSKILGGLEPFEVLVLCCKLKILGHNGYTEDVFKKLLIQSFGQMTCA
ncbi:hypothetical protein L2E82_03489 [Cichorium intybus]|uniref:Uncharacterized protein n=1 Tax=Cichorium intybus TaxID=13427 RepID=A0ACB9H4K4_CICIN|nr:hypothetical protein L2E82_03489 [Cichorium intybus]